MINYYYSRGGGSSRGPSGHQNPLVNALIVVVGLLTIAGLLVVGFFAFLIIASLVTLAAAVIGVRLWWHKRRLRSGAESGGVSPRDPAKTEVIEGEFRELEARRDE